MHEPKFEIFKDSQGQFRFRLVAPNGEILVQSEGYLIKQMCKAGIEAVKKYVMARTVDLTIE